MDTKNPKNVALFIGADARIETLQAVARHEKYWSNGNDLILTFSSPPIRETKSNIIGPEGHNGPGSIQRLKKILCNALKYPHDTFVFGEYDSIVLKPIKHLSPYDTNIYTSLQPNGDIRFSSKFYTHGFLWMSRTALHILCRNLDNLPDHAEYGFGDRWLGALAEQTPEIALKNTDAIFSRNSLDRPEYLDEAKRAIANGTTMIHGIKTEEQLNTILPL